MTASSRLRPIAFCIAMMICCLGLGYAQQSSQLTGKWNMISTSPDGDEIPWTLSITNDDGKYNATVEGNAGLSPAKDFKVDGTKVHLRTTYQDQDYDIDLKLEENKLTGTWSGNGDSGPTKGTKAAASSAGK